MIQITCLLFLLPVAILGFPSGAPTKHCVDLVPTGHGASSILTGAPPFRVTASSSTYTPGQRITVTVESVNSSFKGIMLQARRASCLQNQNETVGNFSLNAGETELKTVDCGDVLTGNTISHVKVDGVPGNGVPQKVSKNFTWVAPLDASGHIYFKATIVQEYSKIFLGVSSSVVQDPTSPALPTQEQCGISAATTMPSSDTTLKSQDTTVSGSASHSIGYVLLCAHVLSHGLVALF